MKVEPDTLPSPIEHTHEQSQVLVRFQDLYRYTCKLTCAFESRSGPEKPPSNPVALADLRDEP